MEMTKEEALKAVIEPLLDKVPLFFRNEAAAGIPGLVDAIINDLPKYGYDIQVVKGS